MVKLGLIAFANNSGLSSQTRRLYEMLHPFKVMVVDSRPFSKNKEFHPEWYQDCQITDGFPKNRDIIEFLKGLTHVFVCENPYNFYLVKRARELGVKVICQSNYEFCENIVAPWLPVPHQFVMPSEWGCGEMRQKYPSTIVLPPPIDPGEFIVPRKRNMERTDRRFLHIVGTLATEDRNGTYDLIKAIPHTRTDFKLHITSQHPLPKPLKINDPRVFYDIGNKKTSAALYLDYDALILPRRYGGLCLPMGEALMSGLPVLMPDISPNNNILPSKWLFPAFKKKTIKIRPFVDVYGVEPKTLANFIDDFRPTIYKKEVAYRLARDIFSPKTLRKKYLTLLG